VPLGPAFTADWEQATKDANTMAAAWAWISDDKFTANLEVSARTQAIITVGRFEDETNLKKARSRRAGWKAALSSALKRVDFIALPTMQDLPPKVPLFGGTPLFEVYVLGLQNTSAVNLAGNPALAIPVPVKDPRVPVTSLQLVGPRLSEAALLNAGRLVEAAQTPRRQQSAAVKSARNP